MKELYPAISLKCNSSITFDNQNVDFRSATSTFSDSYIIQTPWRLMGREFSSSVGWQFMIFRGNFSQQAKVHNDFSQVNKVIYHLIPQFFPKPDLRDALLLWFGFFWLPFFAILQSVVIDCFANHSAGKSDAILFK